MCVCVNRHICDICEKERDREGGGGDRLTVMYGQLLTNKETNFNEKVLFT